MAPKKLSGPGKQVVQITWTNDMRRTLHIIYSRFSFDLRTRHRVFCYIYRDHLLTCGFVNTHPTHAAISAQYDERKSRDNRPAKPYWEAILQEPEPGSLEASERDLVEQDIRQALTALAGGENVPIPATALPEVQPQTPRSKRQRLAASDTEQNDDDEYLSSTGGKRRRISKRLSLPSVEMTIGGLDDGHVLSSGPVTPSKTPCQDTTPELVPLKRPWTQETLFITPERRQRTLAPPESPTEIAAHPPMPALLFRYWDENSQSKLTEEGFVAGRFRTSTMFPLPPPPALQDLDLVGFWYDVKYHLNWDKVPTPFISTTNCLSWLVKKAIKIGSPSGRISVIETTRIDQRKIYHSQPFYKECCRKLVFDRGAWLYNPLHEYWIWAHVESSCVLTTFDVSDLLNLATTSRISPILRIDILQRSNHARSMKQEAVTLTNSNVKAMAQLTNFIVENATPLQIANIVEVIYQGWHLNAGFDSPEAWSKGAHVFAFELLGYSDDHDFRRYELVKRAFLDGIFWGGGDFGVRTKPDRLRAMIRKNERIGLSPFEIMSQEKHASQIDQLIYEKRQQRLLGVAPSQLLLMEPDENADQILDEDEDETMMDVDNGHESMVLDNQDEDDDEEIALRHPEWRRQTMVDAEGTEDEIQYEQD